MGFAFNPFTGNFDVKGAGGGGGSAFFAGEVATYADLPLDGTAALDSRWLVRSNSGTWPFSTYKQAGVYVRIATVGSSRDNDYRLTDTSFFDVMSDSAFLIYDDGDATRNLKFQLSGIDTATTRTLTVPNASGRIQVEGQPIGNTTPAAGTFTTLTLADGTRLLPSFFFADDTDTGFFRRGTNTLTFVTGGSSRFEVSSAGPRISSADSLSWALNNDLTGSSDLSLFRDAADTLAQRRTTNPQTFRLYNTFTDASNHERGFMRWSSNVLQIGTEAAGTGSVRNLDFQVGGTNLLSVRSDSVRTVGLTNYVSSTGSVPNVGAGTFGFVAGGANNSGAIVFYDGNGGGISTRFGLDANNVLAIKSGTAAQGFRIYNTTIWERANFRWASNEFIIDAEAGGTGTLRGIKIGSATSSLLGFYGATPVDRPATVADPTGGGTVDAEARTAINDIIDRLQELGLIA